MTLLEPIGKLRSWADDHPESWRRAAAGRKLDLSVCYPGTRLGKKTEHF